MRKSPPPFAFNQRNPARARTRVDQTWDENLHIVFADAVRHRQKSNLSDYANVRKGGIIAIQIEEGDRLIDAKLTNGNNELVLITKDGMSLRFHEEQLRDQGRNTVGVWGIRPEKGDHVVAIAIVDPNADAAGGRREWNRQANAVR